MIVRSAMSSLVANKMRSILAMLGIIIGVGAVIAMLAIAAGAKTQILSRISALGTNLLVIRPGQRGTGGVMSGIQQNLTLDDAQAIVSIPNVTLVAPVVNGSAQLKYFGRNSRVSTVGSSATYLPLRNFEIEKGRDFTEAEASGLFRVAILGPQTVSDLMGENDPLDQTVKLNGTNFRVIGVLKAKGDQGWFNPDDQAIIPIFTAMRLVYGINYLREIDVQTDSADVLVRVQEDITELLRKRHRLLEYDGDDFTIRNQADILQTVSTVSQTFTLLLGSIAGISLLVGGIGIMNIMLVTVTERTREIGVRKAIGAKDRDILRQFLIEAMLMSGVGGLIGALSGIGAAKAIPLVFPSFSTQVQLPSVVLAISFAVGVGIFFGYYPAQRAAQLDPIEALRYE
ncbi:MAG: ABC transporter permease [Planctomycetota bacterium]|nr:ABC transporter permease [Planctomycetota bacterium]